MDVCRGEVNLTLANEHRGDPLERFGLTVVVTSELHRLRRRSGTVPAAECEEFDDDVDDWEGLVFEGRAGLLVGPVVYGPGRDQADRRPLSGDDGRRPPPRRRRAVTVPATTRAAAKKPLRVLFIGNSYTFFNGGMGTLVQSLAAAVKDGRRLEYVEVTKGGQTLEGHWAEGKASAEIRKGGWDFVVLQEHSLRPLQDREKMYAYAKRFDAEIRRVGARTVFYETWAEEPAGDAVAVGSGLRRDRERSDGHGGAGGIGVAGSVEGETGSVASHRGSQPSDAGGFVLERVRVLRDVLRAAAPRVCRGRSGIQGRESAGRPERDGRDAVAARGV